MEELQLYKLQQEPRSTEHDENLPKKVIREKRKSGPKMTDEQTPAKRKKNDKSLTQSSDAISKNGQEKIEVNESGSANDKPKRESRPEKPKVYTDQCTAFISNLNLKASRHYFGRVKQTKCCIFTLHRALADLFKFYRQMLKISGSFSVMLVVLLIFEYCLTSLRENQGYFSISSLLISFLNP